MNGDTGGNPLTMLYDGKWTGGVKWNADNVIGLLENCRLSLIT